jgi:hypothetical protein
LTGPRADNLQPLEPSKRPHFQFSHVFPKLANPMHLVQSHDRPLLIYIRFLCRIFHQSSEFTDFGEICLISLFVYNWHIVVIQSSNAP